MELNYLDEGEGEQTIVFAHGLLYNTHMWEQQISYFKDRYRCIAFDARGHGGSPSPDYGYDMDTMTQDAISLIEKLDAGPCHFVGLSMGGFIAMRIAARRPDLLKSITLLDTSAEREPAPRVYALLVGNFLARWTGFGPLIRWMMPGMFGKEFMQSASHKKTRDFWANRLRQNNAMAMYNATRAVLRRESVVPELGKIKLPAVIVYGDEDIVTSRAKSENMQRLIAGSKLIVVKNSGHMSAIEKPDEINRAIEKLIERCP